MGMQQAFSVWKPVCFSSGKCFCTVSFKFLSIAISLFTLSGNHTIVMLGTLNRSSDLLTSFLSLSILLPFVVLSGKNFCFFSSFRKELTCTFQSSIFFIFAIVMLISKSTLLVFSLFPYCSIIHVNFTVKYECIYFFLFLLFAVKVTAVSICSKRLLFHCMNVLFLILHFIEITAFF